MFFSPTPKSNETLLVEAVAAKDDTAASLLVGKVENFASITFEPGYHSKYEHPQITLLEMVVALGMTKTLLAMAERGAADLEVPSKLMPQYKTLTDYAVLYTNFSAPFIKAVFEAGGNPYGFEQYNHETSQRWTWMKEVLSNAQDAYDLKSPEKAQEKKLEALISAIHRQDEKTIDRLAARGVDVNTLTPAKNAELPLFHAIRFRPDGNSSYETRLLLDKSLYIVQKLITSFKADVNLAGRSALPLQAALNSGRTDIFDCLLVNGAKTDLAGPSGVTVAESVFNGSNVFFVETLKKRNYDLDALLPNGDTPLLAALRAPHTDGRPQMIETIIMLGADATKPAANGTTPLEYAKKHSTPEALYLIQKACDAQIQRALVARVETLEKQMAEMARLLTERTGEPHDKPLPPTVSAALKQQP